MSCDPFYAISPSIPVCCTSPVANNLSISHTLPKRFATFSIRHHSISTKKSPHCAATFWELHHRKKMPSHNEPFECLVWQDLLWSSIDSRLLFFAKPRNLQKVTRPGTDGSKWRTKSAVHESITRFDRTTHTHKASKTSHPSERK